MKARGKILRHQAGFTLVELLTAMTIGLVLVMGAMTIFSTFNSAVRAQNALAVQADTGRYAIDRLTRDIRMSGYRDQAWLRPPLNDALVVENGTQAPDAVTVRYEGDADCTGTATVAPDFLVTNRFDVVNGNLRCNGEVIAMGVEDFQILLGEDTDGDGSPNRLVSAGAVGLDPSRVNSVRLYLLMVTPEERVQRIGQAFTFFQNLDENGDPTMFDDGRHRLELAAVLSMRNPLGT